MVNLTPRQTEFLDYVSTTDERWRDAKRNAVKRARILAAQEMETFSAARDKAVYDAVKMGIPMSKIGRDGLGTTDPSTPIKVYERVVSTMQAVGVELAATPVERFTVNVVYLMAQAVVVAVLDSKRPDFESQYYTSDGPVMVDGFVFLIGKDRDGGFVVTDDQKFRNPEAAEYVVGVWAPGNYDKALGA